jgi:N-acetylneuraminic acid mutarotase
MSLALLLLLMVVALVGLLRWQAFTVNPEPTAEPFAEAPIGETRWSVSRPMPIPRANMAVAAVGLDIYQIGGETATGVVNTTNIYHTTDHLWREAAARPTAVADTSAAVLFGEIYVPGGRLADGQPTNIVEVYSPANNAWRRVAALPQPIAGGLALAEGGFLYLFGGWNGEQHLASGYVYDPGADTWRPLPSMSQARAFAAGGAVTGRLYVVGGFDGQSELSLCQFFDPTATAWFDCPSMLLPRGGAGSAVLVNKLYVIGGGVNGDSRVTFSEVYDPNTETWQVVNTPMLDDTPAWANLGVASVETRIYVLGGRRAGQLNADNFVYAPFVYQTYIPAASSGGDNEE